MKFFLTFTLMLLFCNDLMALNREECDKKIDLKKKIDYGKKTMAYNFDWEKDDPDDLQNNIRRAGHGLASLASGKEDDKKVFEECYNLIIVDEASKALVSVQKSTLENELKSYCEAINKGEQPKYEIGGGKKGLNTKCSSFYEKMYKDKNDSDKPLDIRFAFGYMDARPYGSVDASLRSALVTNLKSPCPADNPAILTCGFSLENKDDMDILTKTIEGPDGKPKKVKINVTNPSKEANPNKPSEEKSSKARDNFLNGIKESDAVFYMGHARSGNGPDFYPPKYSLKAHDYDKTYGHKMKTDMEDAITEGAKKSPKKPSVLGLFACDSEIHFQGGVAKARGGDDLGIITTGSTTKFSTFLRTSVASLNGMLTFKCPEDIKSHLTAGDKDSNTYHNWK